MTKKSNIFETGYKLTKSNRKTISLSVSKDGKLYIKAPHVCTIEDIVTVMIKNRDWIEKKLIEFEELKKYKESLHFEEGREVYICGLKLPIRYVDSINEIRREEALLIPFKFKRKMPEKLEEWYKKEAFNYISHKTEKLAKQYGYQYTSIKVTNAKQRWGSCSVKGSLCFNWRLLMAPTEVIDYVIIHELVHLEIKNHSKCFWDEVEELCPDYKVKRRWLKENGERLILS
ncbi:MAG: SprT family zinc-dependent metalloprotease [Candidatus Cloacimonadia bacterium]